MTDRNAINWLHCWYEILLLQSIEEKFYLVERHGTKDFWENPTDWALAELHDLSMKCSGNFYYGHYEQSEYSREKRLV